MSEALMKMLGLDEELEKRKTEGIAIGKTEGMMTAVKNIMSKLNMTFEQAMDFMDIPKEQRRKFAEAAGM